MQLPRTDLPVYLPGNGALLMAMSLMARDWEDEDWEMQAEGLLLFSKVSNYSIGGL